MLMFLRGFWHERANADVWTDNQRLQALITEKLMLFPGQRDAEDYGNDVGRWSELFLYSGRLLKRRRYDERLDWVRHYQT